MNGASSLEGLPTESLRDLLAYESWCDGMEPEDVQDILDGNNEYFTDDDNIRNDLRDTYGYNG